MSEEKKNKIEIDQSSLLSLKTELLRKKAEALSNQSCATAKAKETVHKIKISADSGKKEKDSKVFELDDSNDKVKRVLEAKAKYYDKMQSSGQNTTLILFKNKPPLPAPLKRDPLGSSDDYVEFTDSFGRTRSVTREEFNAIKRQQEAEDSHSDDGDDYRIIEETKKTETEEVGESFQKQREEWRRQEQVNTEQNEIFYQDLLFDEAREHGTAFYAFSSDHSERDQQQDRFKQMRKETEKAQSERNLLKKQRDDIIKNRVSHAKARLRQKLGLPPEAETNATSDKQQKETTPPKDEAATAEMLEKEAERERNRKEYIRPWDRPKLAGKRNASSDDDNEGSEEWIPKREKFLMTQDEWVAKQRERRVDAFAPTYNSVAPPPPSSSSSRPYLENDIMANLKFIRKKFD